MVDSEIGQGSAAGSQVSTQPSVEVDASGWAVVTLRGEQDLLEAPRTRRALDEGITVGSGRVVVDLSEVTFSDSSLLGALANVARKARRYSSKVRVVTSDELLRKKFKVTGMCMVLRLFPTLAEALEGPP